ncbi:poly(3-hydroxybutyrate) depolymerase [Dechloromonas denitrificans]|uniref:Poly(3-hydroxybutyrate) depolymerase n=1 Tax=Dechloromonas denitrificans TaxID=281362 RepID=A0A133XJS7_9RHOO|nr:poly(3-hydroxybutyrate) depolymerase [Dechloromonas denitrificans]KXB31166.1 poly(3-hydroxybutyrate) depolymerase [Dechloromonas denitrificans]
MPHPLIAPTPPGLARRAGIFAVLVTLANLAIAAPPLPALNIDVKQTSVSGISSGGFMAVQFQIAHASTVKGAGVIAGGPFYCSRDDVLTAVSRCSCTGEPSVPCSVTDSSADVPGLLAATRELANRGLIDPPSHVATQKVLTVSGARDTLVPPPIARQLSNFYSALGLPAANLSAVTLANAAHTMPTANFGIACGKEDAPYIGKCGFDSAKNILSWIYGPLKAAPTGQPKGRFIEFDQRTYLPSTAQSGASWKTGLDSTGWLYVPNNCAKGEPCRLHIALHGCKQGQNFLPLHPPPGGGLYNGTTFVKNTGYDRWADNNHLVILYPQAVSIPMLNPNGCWDWWGYSGADYATKNGVQIQTLKAMVDRLGSARH